MTKINLLGNPVVESNENYKKELFELIPSLSAIDGKDKAGEDVESTIYGGEEDEEEEDDKIDGDEGDEQDDDVSGEDYEVDEGDEEDDEEDEEEKPNKKAKH